jgi:3-carboxy-cis,cis-muconate cycloisomerase
MGMSFDDGVRLTGALATTPAMAAVFSARSTVQRMLDVESALAQAQADCGVIPASAAAPIAAACAADAIDARALATGAAQGGNLAIPLVRQLTAAVKARDAEAARYVHWGATSQDIIDTGLVLQLRDALDLLDDGLDALALVLADRTRQWRALPMIGRTWLQQALPITLGLKTAGWLDAVLRHRQRLRQLRARVLALQFGGAAGTLASLRERGMDVASALAARLDLDLPATPWHTHRDRIAEAGCVAGMLIGTLGKIARDISLQMQTEVAELAEPAAPGRGGSSTMPHKRNPVGCAAVLTAAQRAPGLVATLLGGMVQEHERALGGWQAEWDTLPVLFELAGGAVEQIRAVVAGMPVNAAAMRANLDLTRGLVLGEAVMLALGESIGRLDAHHLVEQASRRAVEDGRTLREALADMPEVTGHLDERALDALFDPGRYVGQAQTFIDRVLAGLAAPPDGAVSNAGPGASS